MMTPAGEVERKAAALATMAGLDVDDYWRKKAAETEWSEIAETAVSALTATRKEAWPELNSEGSQP